MDELLDLSEYCVCGHKLTEEEKRNRRRGEPPINTLPIDAQLESIPTVFTYSTYALSYKVSDETLRIP